MDVNSNVHNRRSVREGLGTNSKSHELEQSIFAKVRTGIARMLPELSRLNTQDRMAITTGIIVVEESARLAMTMAIAADLPLDEIIQATFLGVIAGCVTSAMGFKYGRFSNRVSQEQYKEIMTNANSIQRRVAFLGYNLLQPGAQMLATLAVGIKLAEQTAKYSITSMSSASSTQVAASVAYGNRHANSTIAGLGIFAAAVLIPLCMAIFFSAFEPRLTRHQI